jgi:hypothetical protein
MSMVIPLDTALGRWAVDAHLERYVAWREECETVWHAYQRWVDADRHERWLAHAGYVAALDREERAARTYADHVEHVERIFRGPDDAHHAGHTSDRCTR